MSYAPSISRLSWMPHRRADRLGFARDYRGTVTRGSATSRKREETTVAYLSRRSVLRGSLALAAAHPFAGPHIARAAATTASMWFSQGFVQDEDLSLRKAVADYEKASGNKIELSITPFAPNRQKIIAALTSGVVPDIMGSDPAEILHMYAWQDRWVDVSDVVETQRAQLS